MKERLVKNKNTVIGIGIVFIYVILLAPYIFSILHSVPVSDDFCMVTKNLWFDRDNIIIGSVLAAYNRYMKWSGEFIYFFLQYLLNPLAYFRLDSYMFGTVLCAFFLLFLLSFRYFIKSWLCCLFEIDNYIITEAISVFSIAILLFANNYHEIFYWYVGSFYEIEYTFAFISIGSMLRYFGGKHSSRKYYVLFTITGIVACNAINMCVIIGASYICIAFLYSVRYIRKIRLKTILPLILYVIMGCITVFAPGNYARKSSGSGGVLAKAVVRAFTCNIRRLFYLSENNIVFYMFIILFFIGVALNCKYGKRIKSIWILLLMLSVCLYGTLLPIAVGYGDAKLLNNRVCFLLDVVSISTLEIIMLGLGTNISDTLKLQFNEKEKLFIIVMLISLFYAIVIKDNGYGTCEYVNQIKNISEIRQERVLWTGIYNEIYDSIDKDVVVKIPDDMFVKSGVIENPALDEDPDCWINLEIRRYFNKDTISVVMNEQDK